MTLDSLGFRVHDDDDDPVLIDGDGIPIDTWRENYPYDERMGRDAAGKAAPSSGSWNT